ncbi:hypothetical protein Ancab_005790 [Ancistrocladus abbreviatus]
MWAQAPVQGTHNDIDIEYEEDGSHTPSDSDNAFDDSFDDFFDDESTDGCPMDGEANIALESDNEEGVEVRMKQVRKEVNREKEAKEDGD